MSTSAGSPSRIGAYPIEREIGRGGMGIVFLGRDTRLDRPVAIKVLPDGFANDAERLSRFEREARLLASLTHPNVAGIHGLEESDGRRFLVLEYVEGETLAQRIARGPLPLDDTTDVCRQIAAALEAAHENGVIHRDLKPGNVKLTPTGEVKVLDFGLAKGGTAQSGVSDPGMSQSPTVALTATGSGVILGTAAYMSPEQARGKALDRRTDIWSFGCVLYECLAGKQAFAGETVSDMIALILQGEPDWNALPADLPPRIRELIGRCLTKDAKKRLRDIGEARLVLEGDAVSATSGIFPASGFGATQPSVAAAPVASATRSATPWIALAAVLAVVTGVLAWMLFGAAPRPEHAVRLSFQGPAGYQIGGAPNLSAVSPDGRMIAFSAFDSTGATSVWVRDLDAMDARRLPGTEDGFNPFWSPDSRTVGFFTNDKLKKVDVAGGSPQVLCSAGGYGRGGAWSPRGVIVFAPVGAGALQQVSASGGVPTAVTELDSSEAGHRFPHFLPDGRHFMYAALPGGAQGFAILVGSIDGPGRERLMTAEGVPAYVAPGYLLFRRNGRLVAQRFDAAKRKLEGEPVTLVDEPQRSDWLGSGCVSASLNGPFCYPRQRSVSADLIRADLSGRLLGRVPVPAGDYQNPVYSPDGRRIAIVKNASATESDLWIVDLARGTMSRLTFGPGRVDTPRWSPDGRRIAYVSDRNGTWDIFVKDVGGAGTEEPVLVGGSAIKNTRDWSPDGRSLLYAHLAGKTGFDIAVLPLDGDRKPVPLLTGPYDEVDAVFSPDGNWVAFTTNESGRQEVYLQSYPEPGRRYQVSTSGGGGPLWSRDGRRLAYGLPSGEEGVVLDVRLDDGFHLDRSSAITVGRRVLDLSVNRDLTEMVQVVPAQDAAPANELTVVANWRDELRRK